MSSGGSTRPLETAGQPGAPESSKEDERGSPLIKRDSLSRGSTFRPAGLPRKVQRYLTKGLNTCGLALSKPTPKR